MASQISQIYIASPGFNEYQLKVIHEVENLLEELEIPNYSPFRDGITLKPDATPEEKSKVFRDNIENIRACDCMIAIIDDRDTGTTFEQGVFYSIWRDYQIYLEGFTFRSKLHEQIFNQTHPRLISYLSKPKDNISVMLTEASLKLCIGINELKNYLIKADKDLQGLVRDDESFKKVFTH